MEAREEPDGTATRREPDSDSAAWAFFARASRLMTRPVRAVAGASGIDVPRRIEEAAVDAVATPTAERTLDEILAGPLPEMIGRSLGRNRVIERIVAEAVKHDDFDRSVTSALESERTARLLREILASPAIERLVGEALQSGASDRVLRSPEFDRALGQVLSSPEVRRALTRQSTSFAGEAAAAARRRSVALDAAAERGPRRWLRRPPRATAGSPVHVPHAGIATRGLALAADAALTLLAFVAVGALVGLIGSLFGELRPQWLVALLAGSALLVLEIVYFVGFWSTVGQTPGMRMMRVRVLSRANEPPGFWRSLVRLAGLALAIIPCFLGFLPALVDNRRRALPDFIAGTVVVYEEYAPAPGYVAPS